MNSRAVTLSAVVPGGALIAINDFFSDCSFDGLFFFFFFFFQPVVRPECSL